MTLAPNDLGHLKCLACAHSFVIGEKPSGATDEKCSRCNLTFWALPFVPGVVGRLGVTETENRRVVAGRPA